VKSTYSFASAPDYVIIEVCPTFAEDPVELVDVFVCQEVWNSSSTGEQPHLPCCGVENTITAQVAPPEGGRVTSIPDGIIDCGTDGTNTFDHCNQTFGDVEPFDGCPEPEITLTAAAAAGWEFNTWSGDCTGTGTCTVTAEQGYGSVTAEFWSVLEVEVVGQQGTVTSNPGDISCQAENVGVCSESYDPDTTDTVTLMATTDPGYVVQWSDNCDPISVSECAVTPPAKVTATFTPKDGVIILKVTADATGGARVWIQNPINNNFTFPDEKYCRPTNDPCIIDTTLPPFNDFIAAGDCIVLKRKGGDFNEWLDLPCEGFNNSVETCDICAEDLGEALVIEANFP